MCAKKEGFSRVEGFSSRFRPGCSKIEFRVDVRRVRGWVGGWVGRQGRMDGWMDGWMDGCVEL